MFMQSSAIRKCTRKKGRRKEKFEEHLRYRRLHCMTIFDELYDFDPLSVLDRFQDYRDEKKIAYESSGP